MLNDEPIRELLIETNRVLGKAVDKGLSDNLPPAEMVEKLRHDVFVFSACKTHIELKELSARLVDENGNVSSWNRFLKEAKALGKLYNENYLQAEYIFATSSAEMAAKWVDVSKDGDRYNLQYRTAGDDRVRDAHTALRNTTLPASDPFWDSYYPPNGWRCRCTAVQVLKDKYPTDNSAEKIRLADKVTTQIDSKGRDRGAMFRFNPGKQQVIFPPNHPYRKVQGNISHIIDSMKRTAEKHESEIDPSKKTRAQQELVSWFKSNLPFKEVGKSQARRFEITREDIDQPIIINKRFYEEVISHHQDDANYLLRLKLAGKAHVFIKEAIFLNNEKPKHLGDAIRFKVYQLQIDNKVIEMKCKENRDGIFLYYMRVK